MKITVFFTNYKFTEGAIQSVNSIFDTASGRNEIELLIGVDYDDPTKSELYDRFEHRKDIKISEHPPRGYYKAWEILNRLVDQSTGDILCLFTNKCIMKTKNWDRQLEPYEKKFMVGFPFIDWIDEKGAHHFRPEMLLPMVHRSWYLALGLFVKSMHADSDVGHTFGEVMTADPIFGNRLLNFHLIQFKDIIVELDRRKGAHQCKPGVSTFYSPEEIIRRKEDGKKLVDFLKTHPEYL